MIYLRLLPCDVSQSVSQNIRGSTLKLRVVGPRGERQEF